MPQRLLIFVLLSLACATGAGDASALGFGRAQPSAVLGQPLDFSVPVRIEAGEVLPSSCVSAEVAVGDAVLPRSSVGASIESVAGVESIRVRTQSNIEEPVVSVTVTAGCDGPVSRRFTLFADPPGLGSVAAPEAKVDAMTALIPPAVDAAGAMSAAAAPSRAVDGTVAAVAPDRSPTARPVARDPRPPRAARAGGGPRPTAPRVVVSRLRMDPPVTGTVLAAAAVAATADNDSVLRAAEEAVSAASAVATAAAARIAALEAGMETVKRNAQAQRDQALRLEQALAEAESRGRWTPLLLAALIALLGMTIWMRFKLRESRAERARAWWGDQRAAADAPVGAAVDQTAAPGTAGAAAFKEAPMRVTGSGHPLASVDVVPEPAADRTEPLPGALLEPDSRSRDVSIDELLDLEQQAEFFIVLGQDDAAIELLVEHLRSSGGSSPLPYLKLMDIYRRRGDAADYERTRDRFNHSFNAFAPGWTDDLSQGRTLEAYPEVIARLQRSWPRPAEAMADLETLLLRSDGHELFDLPAYRDVLSLYSLARDLLEQGEHGPSKIDVLLPLSEGERLTTAIAPSRMGPDMAFPAAASAAVDLDLTEPKSARGTLPNQTLAFEELPLKAG
jgi:pilus assembly protein FimV